MENVSSGEGNAVAIQTYSGTNTRIRRLRGSTIWDPTDSPRVPDIVISERNSKGRFIFTENVSSHPLPTFFASNYLYL